jgi:hypothetical protein
VRDNPGLSSAISGSLGPEAAITHIGFFGSTTSD